MIRPTVPVEVAQRYATLQGVGIAIALLFIVIIAASIGVEFFFPRYNFYWGGYIAVYRRRVLWGRTIYGAVVLALLVGIASSYIASWIPTP